MSGTLGCAAAAAVDVFVPFLFLEAKEAEDEALKMLRVYEEAAVKIAAIPVIAGRKSRLESFAGANITYTIEAMMGDKKALQVGKAFTML